MSSVQASQKQQDYMIALINERFDGEELVAYLAWVPTASAKGASAAIDKLLTFPKLQAAPVAFQPKTEGFYRLGDDIYRVRKARGKEHLLVTKMRETGGERLGEDGQTYPAVTFDFIQGGFKVIRDAEKVPVDEIKQLCVVYGICMRCERGLKAAASVERAIGPVCITKM